MEIKVKYQNKLNTMKIFQKACNSVDRVLDSDSKGQGFKSLHAYCIF